MISYGFGAYSPFMISYGFGAYSPSISYGFGAYSPSMLSYGFGAYSQFMISYGFCIPRLCYLMDSVRIPRLCSVKQIGLNPHGLDARQPKVRPPVMTVKHSAMKQVSEANANKAFCLRTQHSDLTEN